MFLQGPQPALRGAAHCSAEAMLRAVLDGAGGRPVVIKPHPLVPETGLAAIEALAREGRAMTVTGANIHDILARAAVTVSINSAVALEGFLHGRPAILFGRSDFHPLAETVTNPDDFPALEAQILAIFARAGFDADALGLR